MALVQWNNKLKFIRVVMGLSALLLFAIGAISWVVNAADEPAAKSERPKERKLPRKKRAEKKPAARPAIRRRP